MRLLEIFTSPATPLFEAQNYMGMFDALIRLSPDMTLPRSAHRDMRSEVESFVAETRRFLRRNDRIVNYLRWLRVGIVGMMAEQEKEHLDQSSMTFPVPRDDPDWEAPVRPMAEPYGDERPIGRLFHQYLGEIVSRIGMSEGDAFWVGRHAIDRFKQTMMSFEHLLSLPIPSITERVWGWETPEALIKEFQAAEKVWQEERKGLLVQQEGDRKLINFGGGLAWWFLDRAACSDEANAMGHCGNSPRRYTKDRILSLRQEFRKGGTTFLKPMLTFIHLEDGTLGERKARFNNSPAGAAEKGVNPRDFHPEIIALLKLPMIKGLSRGTYAPEEDFKLADLTDEQREDLFRARPDLMPAAERVKREGITPDTTAAVARELSAIVYPDGQHGDATVTPVDGGIQIIRYDNLGEMIDNLISKEDYRGRRRSEMVAGWAYKVMQGEDDFSFGDVPVETHYVEEILDELEKSRPDFHAELAVYVRSVALEEDPDREADEMGNGDLARVIIEHDLFDSEMGSAVRVAAEAGAEDEMTDAFWKWVENLPLSRYSPIQSIRLDLDESDRWGGPVGVVLPMQEALRFLGDVPERYDNTLSEIIQVNDLNEPHYGWNGFSAEAGAEYLYDNVEVPEPLAAGDEDDEDLDDENDDEGNARR